MKHVWLVFSAAAIMLVLVAIAAGMDGEPFYPGHLGPWIVCTVVIVGVTEYVWRLQARQRREREQRRAEIAEQARKRSAGEGTPGGSASSGTAG